MAGGNARRSCPARRSRPSWRSSPWTPSSTPAANSCCASGSSPTRTACRRCRRRRWPWRRARASAACSSCPPSSAARPSTSTSPSSGFRGRRSRSTARQPQGIRSPLLDASPMLRRALALSALFTLSVLAGCLDDSPAAVATTGDVAPGTPNVGGSDKVVTSVFPGQYDLEGPYSRVLTPGTIGIKPAEAVRVPSDIDGEDIWMGLHLPDTTEKAGVLVFASPYFGFLGGGSDVTDRVGAFGNLV